MTASDEIIPLAKKLIAIPSTSDNNEARQAVLKLAKEQVSGFSSEIFEKDGIQSLLAYNSDKRPERFKLILNGHLDVVPAKDDQFKAQEKDGKLYGRGSYDMKAAAATMIILFKELAKTVDYPLGLQLVTDEEIGGFNGVKHQIEQGVLTDFIIAGENTNLLINNESKGIMWLTLTTHGVAAHGAYPWLGENAIVKMNRALEKLLALYPIPEKATWQTTANVAKIETSNQAFNKVPDDCTVSVDVRYIPGDKDSIVDRVQKELGEDVQVETIVNEPAHFAHPDNPFIVKLKDAVSSVTGKEGKMVAMHGASDVRHYERVGTPGVTLGPVGEGHHSDNEWVDISSVLQYYKILEQFVSTVK